MTLLFIEKNQLLQDGWSAADCPRCGGVQPVRLEQVIRTVYFYCLPVGRDLVGRSQRCDYCEHAIASLLSIYHLNVDEWSHADGTAILLRKLGSNDQLPADPRGERCLKSLLDSANEHSSAANIDVTASTVLGGFLGGVLGALLGVFLWKPVGPHTPLDQFGFIFAGLLGGILLGSVTGAMIVALGMPARFAYQRLSRTVADYGVDPQSLAALVDRYPRPVRSAVRRLHEVASPGRW